MNKWDQKTHELKNLIYKLAQMAQKASGFRQQELEKELESAQLRLIAHENDPFS